MVRFHFFHFPSVGNLSNVEFNVSVSGLPILSNFVVGSRNLTHLPPIEEFLLSIPSNELRIDFVPSRVGSIAFVNAIEVFLAPPELLPGSGISITQLTSVRPERNYNDLPNNTLHVIHRINVGGVNIMPENDTLLRYWIPDENAGFMISPNAARTSEPYTGRLNYQDGQATQFNAPDNVYRTAKQMNIIDDGRSNNFNVSWRFAVQRGVRHLVRVHFCDIVTNTPNEFVRFYLYIYGNYGEEIWPYDDRNQLAVPFYKDYIVESDGSGYMNISIGPSSGERTASFLNGVEIMELIGHIAPGRGGSRNQMGLIVGLSVGGGVLVICLLLFAVYCLVSRKKKGPLLETYEWPLMPFHGGGSSYSRTTVRTVSDSPLVDLNLGLKISLQEILYATNKFDPKCMIGQGGFGKVYRGTLRNGLKVAVKRSDPGHGQGLYEFQTEIVILSKIRHRHLVSLIGYCDERDQMILVYEFMEKGTLREHLYPSESESRESASGSKLSWDRRLEICIGAAKGLHYLHSGAARGIIHRDIKSTNILLDENYVAKVADFGLSRSGTGNESPVNTQVKGSFGYLDPEYSRFGQLTQKSDVYSFGVVLLEVLCARPALNTFLPRDQVNLAEWGRSWITNDQLDKIVDPVLEGKINPNCLRKFGETVEKCLKEIGTDRPEMMDVLWDLEYCRRLQHTITPAGPNLEDTTTDVALGLPSIFQRLPSNTIGEDELPEYSQVFSETSDAGQVFSQLKLDDAR